MKTHANDANIYTTKERTMSVNAAMGSLYSTNSSLQDCAIKESRDAFLPFVTEYIRQHTRGTTTLHVADIGCSTGENSASILNPVIKAASMVDRNVTKYYCDLPSNNFTQLFMHLNGLKEQQHKNVFSVAVGRSFYDQLVPEESLDVSWSASAYHWINTSNVTQEHLALIKKPGLDHVTLHALPQKEQAEFYKNCVERDWDQILDLRRRELKEGGLFMSLLLCAIPSRPKISTTSVVKSSMLELLKHPNIPLYQHEWERFYLPMYMRTSQQYLAGIESKFQLLHSEEYQIPYAFSRLYEMGDKEAFCHHMTNFIKAFSENCFTSCLDPSRSKEEVDLITNEFYTIVYRQLMELDEELLKELAEYKGTYLAVVARKRTMEPSKPPTSFTSLTTSLFNALASKTFGLSVSISL